MSGTEVMLSFDPSSGSAGSMPALAVWEVGEEEVTLLEVCRLELDHKKKVHIRLNQLLGLLLEAREEYKPDWFACEYIAPKIHRAVPVNLHRGVGIVQAVFGDLPFVEVNPRTWHTWTRRVNLCYTKSDELDAVLIGISALEAKYKCEIGKEVLDGWEEEVADKC